MSETVIADFPAKFALSSGADAEPTRGRVVMSPDRLVLATGAEQENIQLEDIFDLRVGHVPAEISKFFDDTVTIAYKRYGDPDSVIIESDDDNIGRFTAVLFKAILNGCPVKIQHPARIGGRVTDTPLRTAKLQLGDGRVLFTNLKEVVDIDLQTVTHYKKSTITVDGESSPGIEVRHMTEGKSMTTKLSVDSSRRLNLLGRFLRLEYREAIADVKDMSIPESEMEALVALYSGGSDADLPQLLGTDASTVSMLLGSLEDKGLVMHGEDATALTSKGRVVVGRRIENVNQ